ncbi:Aspartate--tRNA ligase [Nitrosotalea sinensis]|uniref:Aspartate--tRNA ligase n=1 Tax=Nitrosotalea sinensis TaxID=1499975 RepID=A0A2H1EHQ0_9ARCH|nr:aspartate--tRNA(Asn) ligase [Candidatus Nitrosotalea sinensis]SHO46371.1 Aspartate--tRNA ligase [Candidatus Nitrosotalea sinensis]
MDIQKTHNIGTLGPSMKGQKVTVAGWVEDLRELGKLTFLTLRDVTGVSQIVVAGPDNLAQVKDLTRQSVVRILGTVQESKARDFTFEIKADTIDVLSRAVHPLPIDPLGRLESGIDNRLNARALDLRNQKTAAIFKLRHNTLLCIRKTLTDLGFLEVNTPKIIGSASEGGANLFSLKYFDKQAYLAQSPQLYKEQLTLGLERIFEISSFYRAEKSHTVRHLTEFTSIDIEAAFMDYTDVMQILESLVVNVFEYVEKNCISEQKSLGIEIKKPKAPFDRVTYTQAIEELGKQGLELQFGDDLLDSHLRKLGELHPGFYFLTDWPLKLKPFYIHEKDDPSLSKSFDLQYGYLELSSGGRRLHDPQKIRARLVEQGLNPAQFEDHLRAFDWGMPPHSGWGLGLDRLMAVLTQIDNVREVVLYPRDPERLFP